MKINLNKNNLINSWFIRKAILDIFFDGIPIVYIILDWGLTKGVVVNLEKVSIIVELVSF